MLSLSLLVIGIDNLVVQVALRDIALDLGIGSTALPWVVDAYVLPFAGLLIFAGGLADRFGRKRMLLIGLTGFGVALVGASLAGSTAELLTWRALQGVGAALIMPSTLAIVKDVFPAHERAKAIGIWVGASSVGIPLGPLVGGFVLEHYSWGAVFLISVPLVILALVAGTMLVPESRGPRSGRLDWAGAALSVAGLVTLVYGIIEAPTRGWTSPLVLSAIVGGAALLAGFVAHERATERRGRTPMLPMGLLADRYVAGAALAGLTISFSLFGAIYLITQYLQNVAGYDALGTGLRLMPIAGVVLGGPVGSYLTNRHGPRRVIPSGLLVASLGLTCLAGVGTDDTTRILISLAVLGIGLGMTLAPASDTILAATPSRYAGAGSALTDTTIELGGALGIAVLGSIATSGYRGALPDLTDVPGPLLDATRDSLTGATQALTQVPDAGRLLTLAQDAFTTGLAHGIYTALALTLLVAASTWWLLPAGRAGHADGTVCPDEHKSAEPSPDPRAHQPAGTPVPDPTPAT
ncbi:MAG: MFS transporter [Cellulomonas sp.]